MKEHPELKLAFSISCTTRAPRGTEQDGVEYIFLSPEQFKERIANGEFLEYEEVYEDRFYGTLKSQVESQSAAGQNVIFDVDVKGGCNIKKFYGDRVLADKQIVQRRLKTALLRLQRSLPSLKNSIR